MRTIRWFVTVEPKRTARRVNGCAAAFARRAGWAASHCGLGQTAANAITDLLRHFPQAMERRLESTGYEPAFDLDAALEQARELTGRTDPGAQRGEGDQ